MGVVSDRYLQLMERVERAAQRAGRNPRDLRVVLVTKTVEEGRILEAYHAGAREFGENRVQELLGKKKSLPLDIKWHMIGHLQTNKAKEIVGGVDLIHSLDSTGLFRVLERQAELKNEALQNCLVQVNISGEETKFGLKPECITSFIESLEGSKGFVRLRGLMTIGPHTQNPQLIRKAFRNMKEIQNRLFGEFPELDLGILSMGMSDDFEMAIEEGATMIRVGTAVFGSRT